MGRSLAGSVAESWTLRAQPAAITHCTERHFYKPPERFRAGDGVTREGDPGVDGGDFLGRHPDQQSQPAAALFRSSPPALDRLGHLWCPVIAADDILKRRS